jgi:type VI secretion system protein ImpA
MMSMTQDSVFLPDTEALLAPIPGAEPAGISMRYDPLYLGVTQARHEDDASLPMGEWERPLKKADWKAVAASCSQLLGKHSKDFQAAAWLCEAWVHLHQMDGFNAAVDVLTGLVERFWDTAHPQIEDGDDDARVATFIWMNENLPLTLKLHVSLLHLPDRAPSAVSLADWDQALIADNQKADGSKPNPAGGNPLTREELTASASGKNLMALITLQTRLEIATAKWDALARLLDDRMRTNPPSVARVGEMLRRMERAVTSLIDGRAPVPPVAGEPPAQTSTSSHQEQNMDAAAPRQEDIPASQGPVLHAGPITSREDAYRMLEAVAAYLEKAEPHSPTPYLVKRAVTWGRMSLADLMQEVVREEGDITRYFSLLGIKESRHE